MPITPGHRFGMWLRRAPVGVIARALEQAESAGVAITADRLEAHSLSGGDPIRVVEATVLADKNKIDGTFDVFAAMDLFGRDPLEAVRASMVPTEYSFSSYSEDITEPIAGFTRDGGGVAARCTMKYLAPVDLMLIPWKPADLQERLSARISVFINTASNLTQLGLQRMEHQANLLVLAQRLLRSTHEIELEYQRRHAE